MPPVGQNAPGADPAARVAAIAEEGAGLLLGLDPVLGDHQSQVAVDAFVESAAEALRAVADAGRHTRSGAGEPAG